MNEDLKLCEVCHYAFTNIPENFPLAEKGVNRCRRCLTDRRQRKDPAQETLTCDMCQRSKTFKQFSATASEALKGRNICYCCARRAGFNKPHIKMRCITCGIVKSARDFPKDWKAFGQYCKVCIKSGKYTKNSIKKLNQKTPDIAV